MKFPVVLFAGWSAFAVCGANAALFSDEEAHNQIRQLLGRVAILEGTGKQQTEMIRQKTEMIKQLTGTRKQQAGQIYELQKQIEAQNMELRRLRGENEELNHALQDVKKSQNDLYLDLDSRLRRFEKSEAAVSPRTMK
ncbi:YbgF trimerization domain-containing protein [Candidatus Nitrotoga fabula]|uniref:Tol-pal system protein YbgF n=1 Tax=Candidatus Nitrotoga fabula TaxID=2182327 RepID=A0A916FAK2_9PROT|nr:YbgF trimerization domain-containing protein [Candidatus Nitrotoga fabula]CAE6740022.1 Tol-pal system protein YbgF [Candidatus Nitrotoga fabula]